MKKFVQDCTEADFNIGVIEASQSQPVLVDFWAPWCGPCKTLGPTLELLAEEYNGAFQLVKIDTDQAPALMAQFQFRSIPTVVLFLDGKPVDAFSGALPKEEVAAFLEKNQVTPKLDEGKAAVEALIAEAKYEEADKKALAMLLSDPDDVKMLFLRVQIALAQQNVKNAKVLLEQLPKTDEADEPKKALEALLFLHELAETFDEVTAKKKLETNADDVKAALSVAGWQALGGDTSGAFEMLLLLMAKHKEEVHPVLLKMLSVCDDEQKRSLRKKLSMVLF